MLDPRDRVVMISGASRGIGRAVAERLLASGFLVSAGVREKRGLREDERLMVHRYDAESLESAAEWVAATMARFGRIQALVNAAGINPKATLEDADEAPLDRMWEVNVKGPLRLSRLSLPHLRACGEGRVATFASLSGKRVKNENVGYAISKFAVLALNQAIRREGWDAGIRATAICPSFVATDMTGWVKTVAPAEMIQPADLARLTETMLLLPANATVAELLVNCRFEELL
ncbi:MAG TPA: SDR family NAD(P)-dependent oxidoreductase [Acetobacteraceae bacterium]|jgi:NAD(P)-dependent dehydrogenase (short-subunit alcohol dehydrogenase family)|nr:SDR family NAD(P)-dependent oxidoreductase [Acetobacteraceae bacterium]